uniref:Uncharacterized protein n=1 Tax=Oryza brachyantha TaxID=4533 RepID=J3LV84_ORYBR
MILVDVSGDCYHLVRLDFLVEISECMAELIEFCLLQILLWAMLLHSVFVSGLR